MVDAGFKQSDFQTFPDFYYKKYLIFPDHLQKIKMIFKTVQKKLKTFFSGKSSLFRIPFFIEKKFRTSSSTLKRSTN